MMQTDQNQSEQARKRGSGARLVYSILRDDILDLALPPGSPVDEAQLAGRFAMSRTPIREAMVRLIGEGLITTLPNRSAIVSTIDFMNMAPFFDAMLLMYRVTTRLAARHHRNSDMEAIRDRQAEFAAAVQTKNARTMIKTNAAFHAAIAQAGRNPYFCTLFNRILDDGRRYLRLYYQSYDDDLPRCFVDEHEAIIAAIAARDCDRAEQLARDHAGQIVQQISRLFMRDESLDISLP